MKYSHMSIDVLIRDHDIPALRELLNVLSGFELAELIDNKSEEDQVLIFSVLSPKLAAETFNYLEVKNQKIILHSLPSQIAATILTEMPPDDRTALLEELPRPTVDEYIKLLPKQERTLALTLLGYPEDSIGRLMTTDYIAVKMEWTIEEVLDHIREYGHDSETISVIYIVDDHDILLDDIRLRDLLFVPKDSQVSQLADHKFVALLATQKAEEAIEVFQQYDRGVLPVIDDEGYLLGIVTIDDILRLASEQTTETLQKVAAVETLDEPYMETPFAELIKKRAKWLVLLFLGEMLTATAMGFFEGEIAKAVVLALFLPLIISSGGNAGSQSSTLIIRAMALEEIKLHDWWRIMKREILTGLCLGLILGIIGFGRVALWGSVTTIYGEHWVLVALTISLAVVGVVLWGSLSGSMLPMLLKWLGADPATSSAPLVATIVDVTGIIIYFLVAIFLLKGSLL